MGSRLRWLAGRLRKYPWSVSGCCVLLAGILGFLVNWTQAPQTLCTLPGIHSACRSNGWGGVATAAEEALWVQAQAGKGGDGFRAYLARYPEGAFRAAAQARLDGCRRASVERWEDEIRTLPLYEAVDRPAAGGIDALAAAAAAQVCRGFDQGEFRLRGASARLRRSPCSSGRCELDGEAVCEVAVRYVEANEDCAPQRTPR
jgi:hypothetical protein